MRVFIDSSFFVAAIKDNDRNHKKAKQIVKSLEKQSAILYTSYYIIDETATVLSMRVSKKVGVDFLRSIKSDDFPIILEIDKKLRLKTYRFFRKTKDKNIGMIDCYSAILMRENKIQKCFTFDEHFKKLGFEIL